MPDKFTNPKSLTSKHRYSSIVVLTGAGISAESGIQTFRAEDGLWEDHRVEDVATPEAFIKDPKLVHRFYNARRHQLLAPEIQPNPGHQGLADFAHRFQGDLLLVTQNIDNLHERAGSSNIVHMHGEIFKQRCLETGSVTDCQQDTSPTTTCPCCGKQGNSRPHVVWFGEMPLMMGDIEHALSRCDLFVSIGTSGNVYPAAGFVQLAKNYGAKTVELNLELSKTSSLFDEHHSGPASQLVPTFFQQLLS